MGHTTILMKINVHSLHPELLKKGKRLVEISQKVFSLVGNYIRDPIGKVKLSSKMIKLSTNYKNPSPRT
jgi:hypothetical protein